MSRSGAVAGSAGHSSSRIGGRIACHRNPLVGSGQAGVPMLAPKVRWRSWPASARAGRTLGGPDLGESGVVVEEDESWTASGAAKHADREMTADVEHHRSIRDQLADGIGAGPREHAAVGDAMTRRDRRRPRDRSVWSDPSGSSSTNHTSKPIRRNAPTHDKRVHTFPPFPAFAASAPATTTVVTRRCSP